MTQLVCQVMSSSNKGRIHSEEAVLAKVKVSEDSLVSRDSTINSDKEDSKAMVDLETYLKSSKSFSEVNKEAEDKKVHNNRRKAKTL